MHVFDHFICVLAGLFRFIGSPFEKTYAFLLFIAGLSLRNVSERYRLTHASKGSVRRMIILNLVCTYTFKVLYPSFLNDFEIEVKHISEVLAENLDKWAEKASLKKLRKLHTTTHAIWRDTWTSSSHR